MCGITCIFDEYEKRYKRNCSDIYSMTKALYHRGPDAQCTLVLKRRVFLGYTRLSMVDIKNSNQPLYNENKTIYCVFNGEIYNYQKLKKLLQTDGHAFLTDGDGEVIVHLYEKYGLNFIKKLDGMFSICLVDLNRNIVIIARDPFGIKPLYYSIENGRFICASELKSLVNVMQDKKINFQAEELYLKLRFIPAPYTIIQGINKVESGEYIKFDGKNISKHRYFKMNSCYKEKEITEITKILINDVKTCATADAELGIFLSGGFDSSVITSIISKESEKTLMAFSVGYENKESCDESSIAKKVAKELNNPIVVKKIKEIELLSLLNTAIDSLDEPLYSTVNISTLKLAKMAKPYVKGVLTGDGSDELFYGYNYVRCCDNLDDNIFRQYLQELSWLKSVKICDIFSKEALSERDVINILKKGCEMFNPMETLRRIEVFKKLPEYHLFRMDRLGMSNSIEARFPFIRKDIVQYALSIPYKKFIDNKEPKNVIKQEFSQYLTKTMTMFRKKPFTSPIKHWIESVLKDDIGIMFTDKRLLNLLHLNQCKVQNILQCYSGTYEDVSNIWGIYMLLKWADRYIKFLK